MDADQSRQTPVTREGRPDESTPVINIPTLTEGDYMELQAQPRTGFIQYGSLNVHMSSASSADISIGYRRCYDFDTTDSTGQDFAIVRADEGHVVAVVADGVSQSFFGDIAARRVSLSLIRELWIQRTSPPSLGSLERRLLELSTQVASEVNEYRLPGQMPEMQHAALERMRIKGSQAVFVALVLDVRTRSLTLYNVGDAEALVRLTEGNVVLTGNPDGRWSSAGNTRLLIKVQEFRSCFGVVLKTDGAGHDWGQNVGEPGSMGAVAFAQLALEQAPKDDVAFVAVGFNGGGEKPPTYVRSKAGGQSSTGSSSGGWYASGESSTVAQSSQKARAGLNKPDVHTQPDKHPGVFGGASYLLVGLVLGAVAMYFLLHLWPIMRTVVYETFMAYTKSPSSAQKLSTRHYTLQPTFVPMDKLPADCANSFDSPIEAAETAICICTKSVEVNNIEFDAKDGVSSVPLATSGSIDQDACVEIPISLRHSPQVITARLMIPTGNTKVLGPYIIKTKMFYYLLLRKEEYED